MSCSAQRQPKVMVAAVVANICPYFHPTRPNVKTLHVQKENVKNQEEKIRLDFDRTSL